MKAPPGALVSLYYDAKRPVGEGDYIRTKTGRTYRIHSVRIQERGKHIGRQHVMAVVMEDDFETEEGAVIHPILWYSRNKKERKVFK